MEQSDDTLKCPICLNLLQGAVETSCGHSFCCSCILSYLRNRGKRCPLCRTDITSAFPSYTLRRLVEERRAATGEPFSGVSEEEQRRLDSQLPGRPAAAAAVSSFSALGQRDFDAFIDILVGGFRWRTFKMWMAILFAMIYILSPIDIIPDVIPILGFSDDLGAALWLFFYVRTSVREHLEEQRQRGENRQQQRSNSQRRR